ncbi:PWWP domain-containing DNA repair factor 3A isoform X2 [Synchiropus splendidus]|uniref:PWWP domain-containing DNA repair factor 3A isoform X2 n=1 Tax=Synchiropus splendidus TaxID=270530 RepID=UPI00237E505D|nr:PWWP domain-containing DNA repair factor 3A isoform X2 [Synchiropus splendidus]
MEGRRRKGAQPRASGRARAALQSSPEHVGERLGPATRCSSKRRREQTTSPDHPLTPPHSPVSEGEQGSTEKSGQARRSASAKVPGGPVTSSPVRPARIPRPVRQQEQRSVQRRKTTAPPAARVRPRFALKADESTTSSDLSTELSSYEEPPLPAMTFEEDEECDDDDQLPSILDAKQKPVPVTQGSFVWYRLRTFPSWPALVKHVNRKRKTASIMFVDKPQIHNTRGFCVPLKRLKPLDCEDAAELVVKAKEDYKDLIEWALDLIEDYRIRIACGSFSDSFVDYVAHNMSLPVRRKFPRAEGFVFPPQETWADQDLEDSKDSLDLEKDQQRSSRRLLPDRTLAAHNRATEKLVHYIVQKRMVEARLLAVIQGREPSRWLRSFQSSRRQRRIIDIYLEDEAQLDQVYRYLDQLYRTSVAGACGDAAVKSAEKVPFIMDVLLPEAIIHAIAGVDRVSVEKAEKQYLNGRSMSNRGREELHMMIEEQSQGREAAGLWDSH